MLIQGRFEILDVKIEPQNFFCRVSVYKCVYLSGIIVKKPKPGADIYNLQDPNRPHNADPSAFQRSNTDWADPDLHTPPATA